MRKSNIPCPSEEQEQIKLAQWVDMIGLRWCHVPNGGARDKVTGYRLKLQGVKKGVLDNFIFDKPPLYPQYCGAVVELKRISGGVVSSEQKDWISALTELGWAVKVCKGADEAINWLMELGYGKSR